MGISKLTYTLKGVVLREWLLDEDVLPVGSRQRIWENLSIIVFLFRLRASSRNILKGPCAPSSFFSFAMGGHRGLLG